MIKENILRKLYVNNKLSMQEIAKKLHCSPTQVSYWMKRYSIKRRSISDSIYLKNNPEGDPFSLRTPKNKEEAILYGIGIGLYWGEGTKANNYSIRLGNTDPDLILTFISFLELFFSISKKQLRFGVQVFSDMEPHDVITFWSSKLGVSPAQFMKVIITRSRNKGSYGRKIKHGVMTVYFHNTKARDVICSLIEKRRK